MIVVFNVNNFFVMVEVLIGVVGYKVEVYEGVLC